MTNKLFAPYELSLLAKEKGFNEPCLAGFKKYKDEFAITIIDNHHSYIQAPLFQQLVDFLREEHNIIVSGDLAIDNKKGELYYVAVITKYSIVKNGDKNKYLYNRNMLIGKYDSPVIAINKALEQALNLIPNKK